MKIDKFLIKAKRNSFASGKACRKKSSRLGSHDFEYKEMFRDFELKYQDSYIGDTNFSGSEIVYKNDEPIWSMNYFGVCFDEDVEEEYVREVLLPALSMVGEDPEVLPVRGPARLEKDGYLYIFENNGTINNFCGVETIYKASKLVYKLYCHGGQIKLKKEEV